MTDDGSGGNAGNLAAVEHALWTAFVSRTILPGQPIMIEVLAYHHRVSPELVEEVLAGMAEKGLVSRTHPSGFSARPLLTKRELAEIFVVRNRLEPWLAEEAAKVAISADDAEDLRALASIPPAPTLTVLAQRDAAFHDMIGRLSGLAFASRSIEALGSSFHIYRRLDGHSYAPASDREHVAIAEAIVSGDGEQARTAMQRHLSSSSARLLQPA